MPAVRRSSQVARRDPGQEAVRHHRPALRDPQGRLHAHPEGGLPPWRQRRDGGDRIRRSRRSAKGAADRARLEAEGRRNRSRISFDFQITSLRRGLAAPFLLFRAWIHPTLAEVRFGACCQAIGKFLPHSSLRRPRSYSQQDFAVRTRWESPLHLLFQAVARRVIE